MFRFYFGFSSAKNDYNEDSDDDGFVTVSMRISTLK